MAELLHPSLWLLLRLQWRARLRKLKRSASTFRGKLSIAVFAALILLWLLPMAFFSVFLSHPDPARIRPLFASGFFALTILTIIGTDPEGGIFFFPAEVDFLFPAPLERRQLLLYRIVSMAFSLPFVAAFGAVFAAQFVPHGVFAFFGILLMLEFNQLVAIALGLSIAIAGGKVYGRARKIALGAAATLAAIGIVETFSHGGGGSVTGTIRQFAATIPGTVLFAPFEVFAHAAAAERWIPEFGGWFALGLGCNVLLATMVLRLDANFLEGSAAASEKTYRKLQRARSGQAWMNASKPTATRGLPMPGRWSGAGPLVWRQATIARRGLRGLVRSLVTLVIIFGLQIGVFSSMENGIARGSAVGILTMMTVALLPQMLQFDFRGDLERMDALKTLPVSPLAIAIGQLAVPVAVATAIEGLFILGIGRGRTDHLSAAACGFLPVINILIFGIENLIFLWYPRQTGPNAMDLQGGARRMIVQLLKMLCLGTAAVAAAAVGGLVYLLSESWTAALAAAWIVAAAGACTIVPLVAVAFKRFDPARDTAE